MICNHCGELVDTRCRHCGELIDFGPDPADESAQYWWHDKTGERACGQGNVALPVVEDWVLDDGEQP